MLMGSTVSPSSIDDALTLLNAALDPAATKAALQEISTLQKLREEVAGLQAAAQRDRAISEATVQEILDQRGELEGRLAAKGRDLEQHELSARENDFAEQVQTFAAKVKKAEAEVAAKTAELDRRLAEATAKHEKAAEELTRATNLRGQWESKVAKLKTIGINADGQFAADFIECDRRCVGARGGNGFARNGQANVGGTPHGDCQSRQQATRAGRVAKAG
jgi:chromosome segregation ATPase